MNTDKPRQRRRRWLRVVVYGTGAIALVLAYCAMIRMPGRSFRGTPPPLDAAELELRDELARHVAKLATEIGERNVAHYSQLQAAANYVHDEFSSAGLRVGRDPYPASGKICENIHGEVAGSGPGIVVIGAHYDSVTGCPGANDNGSGVAALLSLATRFAGKRPSATLRFVAFPNEEPGHFQSAEMGSWVYAKACRERQENIVSMISLETIAYFSQEPKSQRYPVSGLGLAYPTTGNFISFVGNVSSGKLVRRAINTFRKSTKFPSEGAALPSSVPGIGWSDHWSFWQHGYPAIMVTDTAPFRYPHYHEPTDTAEKLDYDSMARVVHGLQAVVDELASQP